MPHYDPKRPSRIADVDDFLSRARENYRFGLDSDRIDRDAAQDDNRFANAADASKDQWEPETMKARVDAYRPVLQWNRIPTFIQQISNDTRQNKPAIKISQGDGGQPETAEFFEGRIRHIQYECNADIAYDTTADQQITSGRAFLRVSWEYVPGTFKKRICIEAIENQFSVVWDPAAKLYDKSDAEWWFVVSRISKAKHERDYGKQSVVSSVDFASSENPAPEWIGVGDKGELIQIAEYWRKEFRKRTLVMLEAKDHPELGQIPHWKDELPEGMEAYIAEEREEEDVTIWQYVINGAEILSETEGIGSRVPIVPVWGRQVVVEGQRKTFSLIRNAKDPQRLVNLYVSNIAEQIAQMPKSPYLVPIGGIPSNHEVFWQNASNSPLGYLLYNHLDPITNQPLPKPERVVNEPPIQALTIGLQQAIEGIKAAMGIFDASIGARSNETSGIAIQRRQKESDVTNFHFADNQARSRKSVGEILVEIIPLLDAPGANVPVRAEDGRTSLIPIGQPHKDPKTGQEVTHNLTAGDYPVTVATGPSYDSARQEMNERDADLIKAAPELMNVFGDLFLASDGTAGAEERADRMRKFIQRVNPGLIAEPDQQGQEIPPQVQAEMQKMQEELKTTQAFAQHQHELLQTKQPELQNAIRLKEMELSSKQDELDKNLAFKREELAEKSRVELAKLGIQTDITRLESEIEVLKHEASMDHEKELQAGKLAAASDTQIAAQGHQREMQDASQEHEGAMAESGHDAALEQQQQAADLAPKPEPAAK